jgi:hypothetical protein
VTTGRGLLLDQHAVDDLVPSVLLGNREQIGDRRDVPLSWAVHAPSIRRGGGVPGVLSHRPAMARKVQIEGFDEDLLGAISRGLRGSIGLVCAIAALGCGRPQGSEPAETPPAKTPPPAAVARRPGPPWPTAGEAPAPRGFHWETVHHQTIHARVFVPAGESPALDKDMHGYPAVRIAVDRYQVRCQFDSGVGALGATLAKQPPTVYGMAVQASEVGVDHLAARYVDTNGMLRISGFAPGVKCTWEGLPELPAPIRDAIFTVCASVRSPAPGAWRAATEAERAHGGMTDVPDGAWVESELPGTPGSLLRPGKFIAQMHLGELTIRSVPCPASFEDQRKPQTPEVDADLERRPRPRGDVWIRRATETYDGNRYHGSTTVVVPHGTRCCLAHLVPWTRPPEPAKIDYAIALCDTYRER